MTSLRTTTIIEWAPNRDLLRKTLEHIQENEVGWDQHHWRTLPGLSTGKPKPVPTVCGTAMCFAGEAVQLADPEAWVVSVKDTVEAVRKAKETEDPSGFERLISELNYVIDRVVVPEPSKTDMETWRYEQIVHPITGESVWTTRAELWARRLLGLPRDVTAELFHEDNELEDLEAMVEAICAAESLEDACARLYRIADARDERYSS